MVKSIFYVIISTLIITVGVIFENNFIKKNFDELYSITNILYEKTEEKTANAEDVKVLQKCWENKKKSLHAFIPHNEIKEFDMWIGETITLVMYEKWEDALSRLDVVRELAKEIPKTFQISFANIF